MLVSVEIILHFASLLARCLFVVDKVVIVCRIPVLMHQRSGDLVKAGAHRTDERSEGIQLMAKGTHGVRGLTDHYPLRNHQVVGVGRVVGDVGHILHERGGV